MCRRQIREWIIFIGVAAVLLAARSGAEQPGTQPGDDAWPLYQSAIARIRECDRLGKTCPSETNIDYPAYPPFPQDWWARAKGAYEFNAVALAAVHEATRCSAARWPANRDPKDPDFLSYLNSMRNIACEVGDAALYEHLTGKDAAALGRIGDLLHLADLLDQADGQLVPEALTASGVREVALNRLEVIATELRLSKGARADNAAGAVAAGEVRSLIVRVFSNDDLSGRIAKLVERERKFAAGQPVTAAQIEQFSRLLQRRHAERNLAAMSLACQLVRFERSRWPESLDEVAGLLPQRPRDAWGPMGYVIVKGGRADGGDRPMVYSRCGAAAGAKLAYPVREPKFGYYYASSEDAERRIPPPGQFRDVSLWAPGAEAPKGLREVE
jgi:hypothetical protein